MDINEILDPLHVEIRYDNASTGQKTVLKLPFTLYLPLVRMIKQYGDRGLEHAFSLMVLGGLLTLQQQKTPDERAAQTDEDVIEENNELARQMGYILGRIRESVEARFKNDEEAVLYVSYGAMRARIFTRADAALFASAMLGRNISSEAWRKRLDRWVANKDLPAIEQQRGRPKMRNPVK